MNSPTFELKLSLLLRPVKSLRFYSTFKLTSYPATVSWMLAKDTGLLVTDKGWFTAIAVVKVPAFVLVLYPQFPKGDGKRAR